MPYSIEFKGKGDKSIDEQHNIAVEIQFKSMRDGFY